MATRLIDAKLSIRPPCHPVQRPNPPPRRPSLFALFQAAAAVHVNHVGLASLREEIDELSAQLKEMSRARNYFEDGMNRVQIEKLRLAKERDDQLDRLSGRYERPTDRFRISGISWAK